MKGAFIVMFVVLALTVQPVTHTGQPAAALQNAMRHAAGGISESSPTQSSAVITANITRVVSTPGTYGSVVTFPQITGLQPGATIPANSTFVTDSSGYVINCSNQPYAVDSQGGVSGLTLILLGNASEGPFSLSGTSGSSSFSIGAAGIASVPTGNGTMIYVYPTSQSTSGMVEIMGANFLAGQKPGYPVIGNQSYMSGQGIAADSNGAFDFSLRLGSLPAGSYTVTMSDSLQLQANLTIVPAIQLVPSYGHVGQSLVAMLSGFSPGANIALNWGGGQSTTAVASHEGKAVIVMKVPPLARGAHMLYANTTSFSSSAPFMVNSSTVLLSAYGASPGQTVSVSAQGFAAGSQVHLLFNGKTMSTKSIAGANGTAVLGLSIPNMTAGEYRLQASSASGVASNSTTLTVKPTVSASVSSTYVGSTIAVSGSFYYPSTSVKVYLGDSLIPHIFQSGPNGSFSGSIKVPVVAGGRLALGAYDVEGNNATVFQLTVLPRINMSTDSGASGTRVVITGTGFQPGQVVTVLWNGKPTYYIQNISANGTFSTSVPVPGGTPGSYLVSVANSSAPAVVFNLTQYTGFDALLPAIMLPLATSVVAAVYLFAKFRVRK